MKRINHSTFAVRALVLVAIGIACVGCCDPEKKQILALTQENNLLLQKNKETNAELANARSRESRLMDQMDAKDMQLLTVETENKDLKAKLGGGPAGPAHPPRPAERQSSTARPSAPTCCSRPAKLRSPPTARPGWTGSRPHSGASIPA